MTLEDFIDTFPDQEERIRLWDDTIDEYGNVHNKKSLGDYISLGKKARADKRKLVQ